MKYSRLIYTSAEVVLQIKEIQPTISIEENTNFNVRLNQQKDEVGEICCEICTHDLHFSRISTANQEIETAISIEENTNFNVRLNQQKDEVGEICCKINMHIRFTLQQK